jgi:hypothetical protein
MFIGHYGVALALKKSAPKTSLGTLFLATQLVDLLWPLFLLLGLEHVRIDPGNTAVTPLDFYDYPITHSLVGSVFWTLVLSGFYYGIRHDSRAAVVVGVGVFSHWILDFLTHRPDLPLGLGGKLYFGLGLWNSLPLTLAVELLIFFAGAMLYFQSTSARDRLGSYSPWLLGLVLLAIYFANLFGPPPPNDTAVAIAGNALWIFVLWGYWVDRHRGVKGKIGT